MCWSSIAAAGLFFALQYASKGIPADIAGNPSDRSPAYNDSPAKAGSFVIPQEKEGLEFQVLSDLNGLVTVKYNLLFDVSPGVRELMERIGLDLAEYNNTSKWILPVPATDEISIIRSAYVNPNFM